MATQGAELVLCRCGRTLPRRLHGIKSAARTFSTTSSTLKNGPLPTLTAPANPDLDALLASIRSRIFLPSHLRTPQRKLVFRTRHHALLRAEPFMVDIADESVQLEPLDATKDIPDSWKSMEKALDLMRDGTGDWANVVGLLAGMRTAGRRFKSWQYEYVIRTAGEAGAGYVVVDAARAVRRTGLELRDLRLVREAFWACRSKAAREGWKAEPTEKALAWARQLAGLLDDSAHCGKLNLVGGRDPRIQPDIIAVVLELAAMRASRHTGGKDVDGKVLMYAERLMPNLEGAAEEDIGQEVARNDYEVLRWLPVLNGLELAQKVLGEQMPAKQTATRKIAQLRTKLSAAKNAIEAASVGTGRKKRRGLIWTDKMDL